jgi:hypothetical protein
MARSRYVEQQAAATRRRGILNEEYASRLGGGRGSRRRGEGAREGYIVVCKLLLPVPTIDTNQTKESSGTNV